METYIHTYKLINNTIDLHHRQPLQRANCSCS